MNQPRKNEPPKNEPAAQGKPRPKSKQVPIEVLTAMRTALRATAHDVRHCAGLLTDKTKTLVGDAMEAWDEWKEGE